jgi:hypothetical protein
MEIFYFRLIKLGQSKGALVFCEIVFLAVVRESYSTWVVTVRSYTCQNFPVHKAGKILCHRGLKME